MADDVRIQGEGNARHRGDCGYPRSMRLRSRADYLAVQTAGRTISARHFLAVIAGDGRGRIGITVSKRVGNAVTRNRIKRWVREYARHNRQRLLSRSADIVVIAKASARDLRSYDEAASDLARLEGRLR
jgi:ribonuclease P protein component